MSAEIPWEGNSATILTIKANVCRSVQDQKEKRLLARASSAQGLLGEAISFPLSTKFQCDLKLGWEKADTESQPLIIQDDSYEPIDEKQKIDTVAFSDGYVAQRKKIRNDSRPETGHRGARTEMQSQMFTLLLEPRRHRLR